MIKLVLGHLVKYKISEVDDEFKVKFIIYYRYNIFNFKKIEVEIPLTEAFNLTKAFEAVYKIVSDLNRLTKI